MITTKTPRHQGGWLLFLLLALCALFPVIAFAQADPVTPPATDALSQLFSLFGGNQGVWAKWLAWYVAATTALKLVSGKLQAFLERALQSVVESADQDDDHIAERVTNHWSYRLFAYLLDVTVRIKLPRYKAIIGPPLVMLLTLGSLLLSGTGCRTLDPAGVYAGDKILYTAEKTIPGAYHTLDTFTLWEFENRDALKDQPGITLAADYVRANGSNWISDAITMRDAYIKTPTEVHRSNLERALVSLRHALAIAVKYTPPPKKKAEAMQPQINADARRYDFNTFQRKGGGESVASNRRESVKEKCAAVTPADFLICVDQRSSAVNPS